MNSISDDACIRSTKYSIRILSGYSVILFLLTLCPVVSAGGKSMLWEVQSSTARVYLLATIPFVPPDIYPLDDVIENAFEESSCLVLEANITDSADTDALMREILARDVFRVGESIKEDLSPEVYDMLQKYFKKAGEPLEMYLQLNPAFLSMQLSSMEYLRHGYSLGDRMEFYFANKAGKKKTILGLESIREQIDMALNIKDPNLFLKYTLLDIALCERHIDKIADYWKAGDIKRLKAVAFENTLKTYPEFQPLLDEILFSQNRKTADRIKEYLATNLVYFVVLDTGRLVGDRGLIKYIEKAGYKVQRR